MQATAVRIPSGNITLEGRLGTPDHPTGVAVLCHAYPLLGGSMSNAVIVALQRFLYAAGWAALRFNFRGVGRSEGAFDGGVGETEDVLAALTFAREQSPGLPCAVVGWSFGTIVGLRAATQDEQVTRFVGIAPPVSRTSTVELPPLPDHGPERLRTLFIYGTEDPVCRSADVQSLAAGFRGDTVAIEGAGHFFDGRHAELGALVVKFLSSWTEASMGTSGAIDG